MKVSLTDLALEFGAARSAAETELDVNFVVSELQAKPARRVLDVLAETAAIPWNSQNEATTSPLRLVGGIHHAMLSTPRVRMP